MRGLFRLPVLFLFCCLLACPLLSLAWGKTGHEIVAEIAMSTLNDNVRQQVIQCLGPVSPASAAVWMDEQRSDPAYDFMKPWHYINIPEGQPYKPGNEENIINSITIAYRELQHRSTLCEDQARKDLMILFHLVGDLHQPLHTGYASDRGGNDIKLTFDGAPVNLHWIWDDLIIQKQHITLEQCLELKRSLGERELKAITATDAVQWMEESRALLPEVYRFTGNDIGGAYAATQEARVRKQLLYAGLRLGALLQVLFPGTPQGTAVPEASGKTAGYTISPEEAQQYIGKEVTVCGKVYGGKFLAQAKGTPTFINMGAAYPNSPFTVVIFGESRNRFSYKPEEYLNGRQVCISGRVKEFKGKPEIVVSAPDQIRIP